ncbi:MAG: DEAD/DEAH box helicase [Chroococcus sp. CMT-3BRIN-NPC107]|jgi:SNF2 family DNA or RNA helicase|nr:DEAD/DEAH box helicase [Chroococcus sp. CMT-3BRIN-NPC107]
MAILHGSWLLQKQGSCLFIWGETWRSAVGLSENLSALPHHPLSMTPEELIAWVSLQNPKIAKLLPTSSPTATSKRPRTGTSTQKLDISNQRVPSIQAIALPTYIDKNLLYPLHSVAIELETDKDYVLSPWQVEGFCFSPLEAITLLTSLPLGIEENSYMGGDLRFWAQVARWSWDVMSRAKFLPTLERLVDNTLITKWQSLLDSYVDSGRLEQFAQNMPLSCRSYQQETAQAINLPLPPQKLIQDFLSNTIDAQVRTVVSSDLPTLPPLWKEWLHSLTRSDRIVKSEPGQLERLESSLNAWIAPLQYQLTAAQNRFRTCFQLVPPTDGNNEWILAYSLQAIDEVEFLVAAAVIWQHPVESWVYQNREIEQPQETFLRGLGLAARLYEPIAPSLEDAYPESCTLTPLQAYEFIKSVAWRFEDNGLGVVLPPSLSSRGGWANRLGLKISNATPQQQQRLGLHSLLTLQWQLVIGGQTISKAEFDRLVALGSPLVEINGEWVELKPPDIKTAQNFFAARKNSLTLSLEDALRLSTGDTMTIEKLPVVSFEASGVLQELMTTLQDNNAIAVLPTPSKFQGELRPYQQRGFSWLAFLERWGLGACLADDMGLGKTAQLIAFLLHLQEQNALTQPTLVVCPTSVLGNWEREVKKFAPSLKVTIHHGDKRSKGEVFVKEVQKHEIVITSYALVYRDLKTFESVSWQGLVLDEAQNVKNSDSKQSQAVRQLKANFKIALTGTPVENRLGELWSILDFLNPGYLGAKQFFQRRFAMPIEKYGDAASLNTLRSLVQPFILRRLKSDRTIIQDLPEKQEMTVFCGLSVAQATLYQQVVEDSLAQIESAEGVQRRGMILALLVKLKQICNHPAMVEEKAAKNSNLLPTDFDKKSGKLQRLQEMLEEVLAEGDRALIFTQFAEWGKLLKSHLEQQLNREVLFLYGSTTKTQREEMIERFQHDPQAPPIFILSLKAGGVGLNLTRANHVFHFDRWWNPAVENQATDRVFRIGQKRNVLVHKFVCTGTLEEKINAMIESKKELAEQVVGAGEQWLTELDTNGLRDLLILDRDAAIEEE